MSSHGVFIARDDVQSDHGVDHENLTLGLLKQESVFRGHRCLGTQGTNPLIEWCLPWSEVISSSESLGAIAVFVYSSELASAGDEIADAVGRLVKRDAAALIVAIDADARSFEQILATAACPVVVLDRGASYHAVSRLVAEKTLTQRAHVLAYGVSVHRALGEVLYRGTGLTTMAREISRLAHCPTFLLDAQYGVLVYESLTPSSVPDPSELVRLLAARLEAEAPPLGSDPDGQRAHLVHLRLEERSVTVVTAPIVLGANNYGWVVIVELEDPPPPHDVAQHRVIAEQGAMISGSEMLRLRSVEAAEDRARGDFVHALLHARFANAHELIARAAHHGFDMKGRYAVVVVEGVLDSGMPQGLERHLALVRGIERLPTQTGLRTLTTTVGDLLVVVREVQPLPREAPDAPSRQSVQRVANQFGDFARLLDKELQTKFAGKAVVTFGRPGPGATGVHTSYREARIALGISRRLRLDRPCGYAELRVFAALSEVANTPDGREFAQEILGPLQRDGYGGDLEEVALTYVSRGGNLNAAARVLQLHRNTMLYKVDRASRLLGMDLRDPESRFTLWLAHRISMLSEVSSAVDSEFGPF